MGFFSGLRRKVKKLIPKEVRPFIPYAAALIPGGPFAAGGLGASLGGNQFLKAALAKGLTDDEASLKDIARTGIFAAAPTALNTGIQGLDSTQGIGKFLTTAGKGKDATSIAEKVTRFSDPSGFDAVKMVGGAGAIDAGIKAAELNEDALAKYNADLARQGITDKSGRRAAIRAIYANTGTWDMDEVDGMLDTYGYRTGGRVGYDKGGISTKGEDQDAIDKDVDGILSMKDLVEATIRNKDEDEDMDYKEFDNSLTYAKEGYDKLYPEIENQPIRELRLADGGSVEDKLIERVKELQDEGMDFASAMAQAMKEDMAENKARGGIMNGMGVNIQEQIDTPRGDMMVDENIEVAQDMDMPIQDLAEEFEITFGRPAESIDELKMYYQQKYGFNGDLSMMEGSERTMAAQGGLMSMGGNEMDLRGGGFVPMGKAERADDVPARLSKNEFVMTADAVRAAGGGSVQKGADLMYDQMKQLEGQA